MDFYYKLIKLIIKCFTSLGVLIYYMLLLQQTEPDCLIWGFVLPSSVSYLPKVKMSRCTSSAEMQYLVLGSLSRHTMIYIEWSHIFMAMHFFCTGKSKPLQMESRNE